MYVRNGVRYTFERTFSEVFFNTLRLHGLACREQLKQFNILKSCLGFCLLDYRASLSSLRLLPDYSKQFVIF